MFIVWGPGGGSPPRSVVEVARGVADYNDIVC